MKTLCIYHANCVDGFAAATIVQQGLGPDNVEFHEGIYSEPPPDVTGRSVILVDFSYKRPVLLKMAEQAETILILDHHKSAQEELVDLPDNIQVDFDMKRCGAMITWDYFSTKEPPPILEYIQDRDLRGLKLDGTNAIHAYLTSYPYSFLRWNQLLFADPAELLQAGYHMERKVLRDIEEHMGMAKHRMTIAGYDVPVLNTPNSWSTDSGNIMNKDEPFAATYYDTEKYRHFSLRSRTDQGINVFEIAQMFGGGGHKHAAGFRVKHSDLDSVRRSARERKFRPYLITGIAVFSAVVIIGSILQWW